MLNNLNFINQGDMQEAINNKEIVIDKFRK